MNNEGFPRVLREKYDKVVAAGLYSDPISSFVVVEHLIYKVSNKSNISLRAWLKMLWDEEDKENGKEI